MTNAFTASGLFGDLLSDESFAAEFSARAFTDRMLAFEAAWTRALHATGTVTADAAAAALAAIDGFDADGIGSAGAADGLPVPAMVTALRSSLPPDAARAIHTGATSQDVIDTAMALTLLSVLSTLETRLAGIIGLIDTLEQRFGTQPLMARTRMQAALPATVALRLSAWARPLQEHLTRLEGLRAGIGQVQIGGPIGARDLPCQLEPGFVGHVARALDLRTGPVWHTDRSAMVSFGHALALLTGTLGKIGQDVLLMAQQGVDEIALTSGGGSSAMPHKSNPVAAEALVAIARFVAAQQGLLTQAMVHEQERSGTAWALEWLTLPAMCEASGAALHHAERLLSSITRMGTPA
ncbi:3-carboxy-cis,cis-muconate cycloisomerase [Pararhodobacter sp. SW119]|uniref:3-carboxy-cis,cis-muconate cycloisomerase n=1 Tax=Pararhodobacter sp. SW119 TaxID=2780075 RepID=UPI001ADFABFE|nr:3-carboxy-cis,cis-muconate cycloisomerase [Pararhodobacter sp. SW119]